MCKRWPTSNTALEYETASVLLRNQPSGGATRLVEQAGAASVPGGHPGSLCRADVNGLLWRSRRMKKKKIQRFLRAPCDVGLSFRPMTGQYFAREHFVGLFSISRRKKLLLTLAPRSVSEYEACTVMSALFDSIGLVDPVMLSLPAVGELLLLDFLSSGIWLCGLLRRGLSPIWPRSAGVPI